jgi:hypothetical protein
MHLGGVINPVIPTPKGEGAFKAFLLLMGFK